MPDRQTVTDAFGVPFMQISTPAPSPSAEEEARGLAPCQCGVGVWLGAGRDPRAHASLCPVRLRDAITTALTKRDALNIEALTTAHAEIARLAGEIAKRDAEVDEQHWAAESWRQRAEVAEARLEAMRTAALELLDALAAEVTIPEMTSAEMREAADRTARAMTSLRAAVDAR